MFSFIGSQYRVEVSGREYFIDLLLFHRRLRSLVAVELKIGEFQPEHIGKVQFYLLGDIAAVSAMLDRLLHHGHVLKCGPRSWRTKTEATT